MSDAGVLGETSTRSVQDLVNEGNAAALQTLLEAMLDESKRARQMEFVTKNSPTFAD